MTVVDWPGVIPTTRQTVAEFGLSDRFTYVEGDLDSADFGSGHDVAHPWAIFFTAKAGNAAAPC